jgi:hypothetical protein
VSETSPSTVITGSDIVFECAGCGKSMAIDQKGEGITINCPDCGELVQVPDYTGPSKADPSRVQVYEIQIQKLTVSLKELSARRKYLEQLRSEHLNKFESIKSEFAVIQQALDRINSVLVNTDR